MDICPCFNRKNWCKGRRKENPRGKYRRERCRVISLLIRIIFNYRRNR